LAQGLRRAYSAMHSYTFLLAATAVSAADDVPTCACLAKDLGFEIDCTATAVIETAYDAVVKDCLTDCTSADCKKNFAIVESHHDFCLHDQVPKRVEVGFHDLEEVCAVQCKIGRLRDPDHGVCETITCPEFAFQTEEVIETLSTNGCDTKCPEDKCGVAFRKLRVIHDVCEAADDKAFEWAGVFAVSDASHTWSMQKVSGAYADPAMKIAIVPTTTPTQAALESLENKGSNLLVGTCTAVQDGGSMKPASGGSCFQLTVGSGDDSTFTIDTTGLSGMAVYCEHVPTEFERDKHYLYDSSNVDIEPAGQLNPGAFEWAGVFATSDASHTWSMQKVDGKYADPSMKLALIPTATPTEATMESLEYTGANLLLGIGTTCTVVNDGGSMTPASGGSCFTLTVDDSKADSTFTINTNGISGLAVFAQHVPTEFERDAHYLYDSKSVDIEPIAQMGGSGGHAGHDHGHRRLVDVDAALHTYEDACDAVGCYVEAAGCASGTVDLTALDTLKDRAGKKCHVTKEEATACPTATADTSGAKPAAALAGLMLALMATMQ